MRILQVNQFCGSKGGTELYVDLISNELLSRGHHVSLLCEQPASNHREYKYKVHQIYGIAQYFPKRDNDVMAALDRVVELENPDVINTHNIHSSQVTQFFLKSRPTLRYVHDHTLFCPRGKHYDSGISCAHPFGVRCLLNSYVPFACFGAFSSRPWLTSRYFRSFDETIKTNRKLKKLLVASKYMKTCLLQNNFSDEMIELLPYFTDVPDEITPIGDHLLFVGRLIPEKGAHLLLDALSLLPDSSKLVIVGEGPQDYRSMLVQRISRLNLKSRVRFAGAVEHSELAGFYQACNLVVFPSIWPEPFGIVGIEALSFGRPVVAFDSGGTRDWLAEGETGFVVPRGDVRALVEKVKHLLDSSELATAMGEKGRTMVAKDFNREVHMKRLLQIYHKICE